MDPSTFFSKSKPRRTNLGFKVSVSVFFFLFSGVVAPRSRGLLFCFLFVGSSRVEKCLGFLFQLALGLDVGVFQGFSGVGAFFFECFCLCASPTVRNDRG